LIEVLPLGPGDRTAFFGLLTDIYPAGPVRAQLLLEQFGLFDPQWHPVLAHVDYELFLAWHGQRPVGRVAAIIDRHYPDATAGFFGLFETQPDQEAAGKLVQAAGDWLRGQGKTVMFGPLAFNPNQKVGALVEGFDQPPQPALPYNPPYYARLLEGAGLEKEIDLLAYLWDLGRGDRARLGRVAQQARRRLPGLVVRELGGTSLLRTQRAIGEVYNRCMTGGWGFVPLTDGETAGFVRGLASRRGIYLLAEASGRPAGISLSLPLGPAASSGGGARFRLAILGVVPEYQNRGLAAVLIEETVQAYARRGCRQVEMSLVAENNTLMNRLIRLAQPAVARRCRVYRMALDQRAGQDHRLSDGGR